MGSRIQLKIGDPQAQYGVSRRQMLKSVNDSTDGSREINQEKGGRRRIKDKGKREKGKVILFTEYGVLG